MSDTTETDLNPAGPGPTLSIPIVPPIVWQGGSHDSLNLQEPTVGQKRKAAEQLRMGQNAATINLYEIALVAAVSGKEVGMIERLPVSIHNQAMAYLDYFLELGRRTQWT